MNLKNTLVGEIVRIIHGEYSDSGRADRYLLLAVLANIPMPFDFIPYLTETITVILLMLYLKNYPRIPEGSAIRTFRGIPVGICILSLITVLVQFDWFPLASQLVTVTLLGILFLLSRDRV